MKTRDEALKEKFKPCGFCGGNHLDVYVSQHLDIHIGQNEKDKNWWHAEIICYDCETSLKTHARSGPDAFETLAKKWNKIGG